MATYVTKKCPHCGYIYQFHQSGDQRKYGCPYQTCTRCHGSYWDTDIKEPALYGYENLHETKESIKIGITIALYTPLGLVCLGLGIFMLIEGSLMGLFLLAIGAFVIWTICSHFQQKIYDDKHRDEIIETQQKNYDASLARLKDTNYLTALAEHDRLAKKLLEERIDGNLEHYAIRPQ